MLRMETDLKSRHWYICVSLKKTVWCCLSFSSFFQLVAKPQVGALIKPALDGRTCRVPRIECAVAISCEALRY